jgi:DNA invertase Pin-like site-specific DNA recombinase
MGSKVIYTRISKDPEGVSASPEAQHDECVREAKRHGWAVDSILHLSDVDMSAWNRAIERPAWNAVLEGIADGSIDGLIVHHLDRMLRQVRELEELITVIEDRGGRFPIYSVHGDLDLSTPDGRAMARILVTIAQKESDDKSRRLKLVLAKNAEQGKVHGGIAPYGWDEDRITINPHEARVVRQMVDWLMDGESLAGITRRLNAAGEPTRKGGRWYPTTVKQILMNPRLAGMRTHNGVIVSEGEWEPIIDLETHRSLCLRLDGSAHDGHNTSLKHWLVGALTCGICGRRMRTRLHHVQGQRYVCRKDQGGCGNGIAAHILEQIMTTLTIGVLKNQQEQIKPDDTQVQEFEGELAAAKRRRDQLAADYYGQQLLERDEYLAAKKAVGEVIADLTMRIRAEEVSLAQSATDIDGAWDGLNPVDKRAIVTEVFESIVVNKATPGRRFDPTRVVVTVRGASIA